MSAYFVIRNRVTDRAKMQAYFPLALESLAPYKPDVLVREENSLIMEGATDLPRTIIIKFKSRDEALSWYNSPAYQKALPLRLAATEGYSVLVDEFSP